MTGVQTCALPIYFISGFKSTSKADFLSVICWMTCPMSDPFFTITPVTVPSPIEDISVVPIKSILGMSVFFAYLSSFNLYKNLIAFNICFLHLATISPRDIIRFC